MDEVLDGFWVLSCDCCVIVVNYTSLRARASLVLQDFVNAVSYTRREKPCLIIVLVHSVVVETTANGRTLRTVVNPRAPAGA